MKVFKLILTLVISYVGVLGQGHLPFLSQWILIYSVVFIVSWFGGLINGLISTVFSLSLAGLIIIPRESFGASDVFELVVLCSLGFWISFSMDQYKKSIVSLSHSERLEKSLGFTDTLLENIPLMVFVKDAKDLAYVKFNKTGLELLGYEAKDLLGKSDRDFFPEDQVDFFISKDREVLSGASIVDIPYELVDTRFLGQRILHTKKIPIMDKAGKPLYLLGVSEDITESYQAEKLKALALAEESARLERLRLRENETFVATAIASLSESLDYQDILKKLVTIVIPSVGDWATLIIKNEEGVLERVASVHRDASLQPVLDKLTFLCPPSMKDVGFVCALEEGKSTLLKNLNEANLSTRFSDERRVAFYLELGLSSAMIIPIKTRGKVLGLLAIARGIQRESFDELDLLVAEEIGRRAGSVLENSILLQSTQKAVRVKDEFLSIASHELKTPITSLKLQLQMIERNHQNEQVSKPVKNAIKQLDRLTLLVNDLLEVSRLETGRLTYQFKKLNVGSLVSEVVENLRPEFERADSKVSFELINDGVIDGDAYRLEQVVVNLMNNALKYGYGKPVSVVVSASRNDVIVSVKDSGKGIPLEYQKKIFDKFERGRQDSNISGLGLGLFIANSIVLAHQGRIELESSVEQGSVFRVFLPLRSEDGLRNFGA